MNFPLKNKQSCTPLCEHVRAAVEEYFAQLDGHSPGDLYNMVMQEAEKPLIKTALGHCGFNQSKTAIILGISRSTLRKKMALYNLE